MLLEFAREFIKSYTETIDANYPDAKAVVFDAGLERVFFPLYGRQLGVDLAIAAFYTQIDFYLFFLDESGTAIVTARSAIADRTSGFGREWTVNTPKKRRIEKAKEYLGLDEPRILRPLTSWDAINIPERSFIALDIVGMRVEGQSRGIRSGHQAGTYAESALPAIQEDLRRAASLADIAVRYMMLKNSDMRRQARGDAFEELWRDMLTLYGWRPKKFRISGEENDFTAIYQGLHILGEVRWFSKPMSGGKMREFLAKLDPRPQTIGLFISNSGVDKGGMSVIRRAVNTKTVVIFGRKEIESIMLGADPGPVFDEKLREAYDYIFESSEGS